MMVNAEIDLKVRVMDRETVNVPRLIEMLKIVLDDPNITFDLKFKTSSFKATN